MTQLMIAVYPETKEKLVEMKHELKQDSMDALLKLMIDDFYGMNDEIKLQEESKNE